MGTGILAHLSEEMRFARILTNTGAVSKLLGVGAHSSGLALEKGVVVLHA